ncbi:ras and Rab interactor-like protein, partial [Cricetulus griseus]
MPDCPHLLAFLSASRDVLPRTLLLPTPTVGPGDKDTDPVRLGCIQVNTSGRVLSVVNQLYLDTHGDWGTPQAPQPSEPATDQKYSLEAYHPGADAPSPRPALVSVVEEEEEADSDNYKEESREDLLTAHICALARARSSYVARQYRGLRARLTSNSGNPYRPGDPATELLQDVRQLLADLQDYLAKDPDVRAVFGNREPRVPRDEDLGNENRRETSQGFGGCHGVCSHPTSPPP